MVHLQVSQDLTSHRKVSPYLPSPPEQNRLHGHLPFRRWLSGWRTGAFVAAALALASLVINIAAAVWLKAHPDAESNLVEIFKGDCSTVSRIDLWVHLGINTISTLLLGGSNFCMQCLCAPTRNEVDQAHMKGKFLDIGVPSIRNLSSIAWHKKAMWWILGLSSLPLHLLYNSAFYSSISTNDYLIFTVTPDFLMGAEVGALPGIQHSDVDKFTVVAVQLQEQVLHNHSENFEHLKPLDCIKAYSHVFLQDFSNLIVVANNKSNSSAHSVVHAEFYEFSRAVDASMQTYQPFYWVCTSDPNISNKIDVPKSNAENLRPVPCDSYVDRVEAVVDNWQPWGVDVDYCLAERASQKCSFNGNVPIVLVVIVANAIKMIMMSIIAFGLSGNPLMTLGDALESFLETPDNCSKGLCLMTRDFAESLVSIYWWAPQDGTWLTFASFERRQKIQVAELGARCWHLAATLRRWVITLGLIIFALILVLGLFLSSVKAIQISGVSMTSLGFGETHASAIISGWKIEEISEPSAQILAAILIANLPQAILSLLYINLNGLLTTMWMASEWSDFATERKTLRVSKPRGQQRSTHFLQLPYKAAIPLLVASGLLHWLVSQSIFLAVVAEYDYEGSLSNPIVIASCGFSPLAIISVVIAGSLLIVVIVGLGHRKYDPTIPLVGSCSIAISAACHRPDWDVNAATSAIQWGAIPSMKTDRGVGHCCFTSGDVEPLQKGKLYAGQNEF